MIILINMMNNESKSLGEPNNENSGDFYAVNDELFSIIGKSNSGFEPMDISLDNLSKNGEFVAINESKVVNSMTQMIEDANNMMSFIDTSALDIIGKIIGIEGFPKFIIGFIRLAFNTMKFIVKDDQGIIIGENDFNGIVKSALKITKKVIDIWLDRLVSLNEDKMNEINKLRQVFDIIIDGIDAKIKSVVCLNSFVELFIDLLVDKDLFSKVQEIKISKEFENELLISFYELCLKNGEELSLKHNEKIIK